MGTNSPAFSLHGLFSHVPQTKQGHHLSPGSMGQEPWIGRRECLKHGRMAALGKRLVKRSFFETPWTLLTFAKKTSTALELQQL